MRTHQKVNDVLLLYRPRLLLFNIYIYGAEWRNNAEKKSNRLHQLTASVNSREAERWKRERKLRYKQSNSISIAGVLFHSIHCRSSYSFIPFLLVFRFIDQNTYSSILPQWSLCPTFNYTQTVVFEKKREIVGWYSRSIYWSHKVLGYFFCTSMSLLTAFNIFHIYIQRNLFLTKIEERPAMGLKLPSYLLYITRYSSSPKRYSAPIYK